MEPSGTKNYKGQAIRFTESGSTVKLYTEDFLKVVPKVNQHLQPGELHLVDVDFAASAAGAYGGDEEFGDWIKDEFMGSPIGTQDEDALPPLE